MELGHVFKTNFKTYFKIQSNESEPSVMDSSGLGICIIKATRILARAILVGFRVWWASSSACFPRKPMTSSFHTELGLSPSEVNGAVSLALQERARGHRLQRSVSRRRLSPRQRIYLIVWEPHPPASVISGSPALHRRLNKPRTSRFFTTVLLQHC